MRRLARIGITSLAALLLLAFAACGADYTPSAPQDGGPEGDAAIGGDGGGPMFSGREDSDAPGDACFDGFDNDDDEITDCREDACRGVDTVCCIGSSATECCGGATTQTLTFAGCSDFEQCGGSASVFGAQAPTLEEGRLVPNGEGGHAGVTLGPRLAPNAAPLTLSATVTVPAAHCLDCVDVAGVALLEDLPLEGGQAPILAGVFVVGARQELALMVADEIVARAPMPSDAAIVSLTYADGALSAALDGELFTVGVFEMPESVQPTVLGRTDAASEDAAGVVSASLSRPQCDTPNAIARSPGRRLPVADASWRPAALGRSSLADFDGETWMAFEDGGRIAVAPIADMQAPTFVPGADTFDAVGPSGSVRLSGPWLEAAGDEAVLLFISEAESDTTAPGDTELYEVRGPIGERFAQPTDPLVRASDLPGVRAIATPTRVTLPNGLPLLVIAATFEDGATRIVRLHEGEAGWRLWGGSRETATLIAPSEGDLFAFDSSHVGSPALARAVTPGGEDVLYLYYTGFRGARPSIGLAVSRSGDAWRHIGQVLGRLGEDSARRAMTEGDDSFGVTDAAPRLTPTGVELHYRGVGVGESAYGVAGSAGTIGE